MTYPGGQPSGPPLGYPPAGYTPPAPTNGLAIAALVSSLVFAPVGIVLGLVALKQISRTRESGRGMAIAGVVIGGVGTALAIGWLVLSLVFFNSFMNSIDSQSRTERDYDSPYPTTTTETTTTRTTPRTTTTAPTTTGTEPSLPAGTGAPIARADVEKWLGTWSGPVDQEGSRPYSVQLHLEHDGQTVVGTVVYPELSCSGVLNDASLEGGVLSITETITEGTANCFSPVALELTLSENEIAYHFASERHGDGSGILRR